MRPQKNENARIRKSIETFLSRAPLEQSSLVLDGTGLNASYQYITLALLGLPRLEKLKCVDIVSGSTFATLFFLALRQGHLPWKREDIGRWVREWPGCFGISRYHGVWRPALNAVRRKPLLDSRGLVRSLEKTVSAEFYRLTVAELPANFRFWTYDLSHAKLVEIRRGGPMQHMPLSALVECATSVPKYFGTVRFEGVSYCDPVYSPAYRQLRQSFRSESRNSLVSNMFVERMNDTQIFFRPHAHANGNRLLLRDFALFLFGLASREVTEAAENGLFDTSAI